MFWDRGDTEKANALKPYVLAMNNNLAWEINNLGVVTPNQLGVRDVTYALLTAVWKVGMYELEDHPEWYKAIWAMWNSGYFNTYNTGSVCVGLYLLIKSNTAYVPLNIREPFITSIQEEYQRKSSVLIFPNPSNNSFIIEFDNKPTDKYTLHLFDIQGRLVRKITDIQTDRLEIERKNLKSGTYFFQLLAAEQVIATKKIVIE